MPQIRHYFPASHTHSSLLSTPPESTLSIWNHCFFLKDILQMLFINANLLVINSQFFSDRKCIYFVFILEFTEQETSVRQWFFFFFSILKRLFRWILALAVSVCLLAIPLWGAYLLCHSATLNTSLALPLYSLPTRFADGVFSGLAGFVFLKELPLLRLNLAFPLDSGFPSKVPRSFGTCWVFSVYNPCFCPFPFL